MVERRPGLTLFSHLVLLLGIAVVAFPIYLAFVASTHTRDAIVSGSISVSATPPAVASA